MEFILGLYDVDNEDGENLNKREEICLSYFLGIVVFEYMYVYIGFGNYVISIL